MLLAGRLSLLTLPPLLLAALLSLLTLAPLLPASATLFADENSVTSDAPILINGVDVGAVVLQARDTAAAQGEKIREQQLRLIDLQQSNTQLRRNLSELNIVIEKQTRLLDQQGIMLQQQLEMIQLLEEYQRNNTARLLLVEATARALTIRTAADEATTVRLGGNVTSLESAASALNSTVSVSQATDLATLEATTATHAADIDQLRGVDAAVEVEMTAMSANASALSARVDADELAAAVLKDRVSSAEDAATVLTNRMGAVESAAAARAAVQVEHGAKLGSLDTLSAAHGSLLAQLESDAATTKANAASLRQHDVDTAAILAALAADAAALRARLAAAEQLQPGSSDLVDTVLDARRRAIIQTANLTALEAALKAANASIVQLVTSQEGGVANLTTRMVNIETNAVALQAAIFGNASQLHTDIEYVTSLILNFSIPKSYRYVFLQSGTWVVPPSVTSAFVTMAGGGGTGYGWRIYNAYQTGASGGYVFSQPVKLVSGETITVTVGAGGQAAVPYSAEAASPGPPYYVQYPPPGDPGTAGWPGTASALTSPTNGDLLRCAGGSGMSPKFLDSYDGGLVVGAVAGAIIGSGKGTIAVPNRPAAGPWATDNGPGACGPDGLGLGNSGSSSFVMGSGSWPGGLTPFGYGTGGGIGRSGCFITFTNGGGQCTGAAKGRDGVVFIDVMY